MNGEKIPKIIPSTGCICHFCGRHHGNPDQIYCLGCGKRIHIECSKCGRMNLCRDGINECTNCGEKLLL